jgi:hypothetical protein
MKYTDPFKKWPFREKTSFTNSRTLVRTEEDLSVKGKKKKINISGKQQQHLKVEQNLGYVRKYRLYMFWPDQNKD